MILPSKSFVVFEGYLAQELSFTAPASFSPVQSIPWPAYPTKFELFISIVAFLRLLSVSVLPSVSSRHSDLLYLHTD